MRKFIWITCIALLFLSILFFSGKKMKQRWIVEKTIKSEHWQQRNQIILEATSNKYKVVFLGNSLTEMWDINYYFNDSTILKPEKLFIEIGINDMIEKISLDEICTNYKEVVTTIQVQSPQTKIFIQSNLPVIINRPSFLTDDKDVNNRVLQQNENLKKMCKEFSITYIDIHTTFANYAKLEDLFIPDGIHLTPMAYNLWKTILMPYLYTK
jgi:hypothetical protein